MTGPLIVTAAEVFCPIGLDIVQAATSVMTGISRTESSSLMDDRFEPITMGLVPEEVMAPVHEQIESTPFVTALSARLLRLLSPCLENLFDKGLPIGDMPMFLAGPSELPDRKHPFHDQFFEHLKLQSGVSFNAEKSRSFRQGRAGFFHAIKEAASALEDGEHVLVGGVDSMFDPMVIAHFLLENRISREGVMDGFTPGEGAALMVISRNSAAKRLHETPSAVINGCGMGNEEGHRYSDLPYRGDGLSCAFHEMFEKAGAALPLIETVFAGFNGESFSAKEWSVAFVRNKERFVEDFHMEHPAEYLGDGGAASAAIAAAVSAYGLRHNVWKSPLLVWASSDHCERGAAVMSRVEE
jgi:3-oxoacyl-[acyl-carrier-protein] synthase-1